LDKAAAEQNGSSTDGQADAIEGVSVIALEPKSIAAASGVLVNDVIVKINGVAIDEPNDVFTVVKDLPIAKPVPVLVQRGNTALFLTLTLPATIE